MKGPIDRLQPLITKSSLAISRRAGRPECPRNKNQCSNEDGGKCHNVRVFQCPYQKCIQNND